MQTAVVESSGAANPRVPVLKLRVVSLSPTFAGRDLTWCRLKSHMAEELLFCERPTKPTPVAKNGLISQHAWLATKVRQAERGKVTPRIAPGNSQVVTDEELIDQLSFPAYRRPHSRAYPSNSFVTGMHSLAYWLSLPKPSPPPGTVVVSAAPVSRSFNAR